MKNSMNTNTIEYLLQQATATWGEDSQMLLALEECGELIAVLSQYMRGRRTKEEVVEEIADVSIMMRQLRLIFGYQEVNKIEAGKIIRLKQRLSQHQTTDAILEDLATHSGWTQHGKPISDDQADELWDEVAKLAR